MCIKSQQVCSVDINAHVTIKLLTGVILLCGVFLTFLINTPANMYHLVREKSISLSHKPLPFVVQFAQVMMTALEVGFAEVPSHLMVATTLKVIQLMSQGKRQLLYLSLSSLMD